MNRVIKFHSRRYDGESAHVPFLAPWWGVPREDPNSLHRGQFDAWAAQPPSHYIFTDDPAQADAHVLSIPWKATRGNAHAAAFADEQIRTAARLGKRILIFFDSDHDDPIAWPEHAVVFRFSLYCDTKRPNEFSIPTFSQDFLALEHGGVLQVRAKTARPSVGFCGYAPPVGCRLSRARLRESLRYIAYRTGLLRTRRALIAHAPRVQAILGLRRSREVDAHFLVRDQFAFNRWGVLQPGGTAESATRQRREFIANLQDNDYALCARGLANCSIRFYEAISLGRLPLFVNTHCVLPYDWLVDWQKICAWVEEKDLSQVGRLLASQHAQTTSEEFLEKQRTARVLFTSWITPTGFFGQIHLHLDRLDSQANSTRHFAI